ncbi:MAG: glycine cleavage system protein GcvH [Elusimicrobiota bacterium]|nr:glycine cleavage system protein GcvH [Elusimicrobiota bacterium]
MIMENILLYSKSHEWIKKDKTKNVYIIGISEYATRELGDIVYVELPVVGDQINLDKSFGVVESVKSVSDLIAPVSGKILEINSELENYPELVNQDPLNEGWMIKVEINDPKELEKLLNETDYKKFIEEEK